MMIKVYIIGKSNNVSKIDIFEKFFQCVGTETFDALHQSNLV